jgi:CheY-like chemotaxis protein
MKASRLRSLFFAFASATALTGALSSPRAAWAEGEALKDAVQAYKENRYADALAKLQEYVAANPSDEEVYALLRDVDEKVLIQALSQRGEHERLMKYLLGKARPSAAEQTADAAAIKAKADEAVTSPDFDTRRRAAMELRGAGELAVPHLVGYLGAAEAATVVNAMNALRFLGQDATLALAEVLSSDDARVRAYAAAALGQSGDPRAAAPLARQAETDADPIAKQRALEAMATLKASGNAADLYVAAGQRYYANDPAVVMGFDSTRNVWRWEGGALVRYTVPSYLYAFQLAEEAAWDALALQPNHRGGRSLLVRALLAQKVEADVLKSNGKEAPEALGASMTLAASQGFQAASDALAAALKTQDWDVAVEACDLLALTYGKEELSGHPLGDALVAPERRVRYAAAIAALLMSPKRAGLANADKVADLAARAASERAYRQVLVIDDNDDTRSALVLELGHSRYVSAGEGNGYEGLARAKSMPTLDVVVISANLGDGDKTVPSKRHYSSLAVIDELLADARTKDMKIVVRVDATQENAAEAVQKFFQDKYGDKIAGFVTTPIVATAALQTIEAAAAQVELNPDRERANKLAVKAAQALAKTDFSCASFNLQVALEPLVEAATGSDSSAELKLAATQALGNIRVGGSAALAKVLADGEGDDLKAAAATSLGQVLSAQDGTPEDIAALIAASAGDSVVAKAALQALGQVKGMTPEQRNKAFADHRLPLATKAE